MKKHTLFHIRILAGIFIILLLSFLRTAAQGFDIKTYTTKDGLTSNYTWSISQDKLGYLWIGTFNGLNRFDGKDFLNYSVTDGLPDARVGSVFMDSHNRLWINTLRAIAEFKGEKFFVYPMSDSPKLRWSNITETKDHRLWALTNAGVYEFRNEKWWKLQLYPGYDSAPCRDIVETPGGMYINYGGLVVIRKADNSYKVIGPAKPVSYYYNKLNFYKGQLFLSTIEGLCAITNETLQKMPGDLGNLKGVYTYFCDRKNRLWIGDESFGLRMMDPAVDNHLVPIYRQPLINLISYIAQDQQGNIWVADYNGLIKITEAKYKTFSAPLIIDSPAIRNVLQPPGQPLLLNNGTLIQQQYINGKFVARLARFEQGKQFPGGEMIIDHYAFDDHGRSWYYVRGFWLAMQKGIDIYDQGKALGAVGDQAFDVIFDQLRKRLLVAARKQPYPCQYDEGVYSVMAIKSGPQANGNIMRLHQCTNGTILFATDAGAIYSINKENVCKLELAEFNLTGAVNWFFNDPSGDVWIAYAGRGLRRYRWKNDSLVLFEEINKSNFLSSNISSLCFDDLGNLWVCTTKAVVILSDKNNNDHYSVITAYPTSDLGVENAEASRLTKDAEGNIWLSSSRRMICFYPQKIMQDTTPTPTVQIENIKLNLQQTNWAAYADSLYSVFQLPYGLKLPYNKNNLGIYFRGISSSGTEGIQYSYQLNKLDSSWSSPSSDNFVSFVNLSPGSYNFKVKTRLPNTGWSQPLSFSFEIEQPIWDSWWFRLLVLVLASSLVIMLFRLRIKQIRSKTEIANQLRELEMKALKAQMNPHFIYNALNSIQSLIINNKTNEASSYISKFAKLLRQVLENADKNLITLDKEIYSLQLYRELEMLRMDMRVEYNEHIDENLVLSSIQIPPLIFQPFVENALWHGLSRKQGQKKLLLSISEEGDWIICVVTDNGIGRKKATEDHSNFPEGHLSKAVAITEKRLTDFNRTMTPPAVEFIDLADNVQPTGTKVIIRIRKQLA